jgi:cytochrome bd-type quinol oxidase subunit 2
LGDGGGNMESQEGIESKNNLLTLVEKAYKYYNLSLLSFIIFKFGVVAITYLKAMSKDVITVLNGIGILIFIFVLWSVYKITGLFKKNNRDKTHPVLWVILMFLPLFNLVGIFLIYNKARKFMKELRS